MKLFKLIMKYSSGAVWLALFASVVYGLASMGLIALIQKGLADTQSIGTTVMTGFFVLCVLLPVTRVASELLLARLAQQASADMRMNLCRQVMDAPLARLEGIGSPQILPKLTEDVVAITGAASQIPSFFMQFTIVIGCLGYMAWLSWVAFLGVLGFIGAALAGFQVFARKGAPQLQYARESKDALYKHLRALTEGTKELKLHQQRQEAFLQDLLLPTVDAFKRHSLKGTAYYSIGNSISIFISFLLAGLLLFVFPAIKGVDPALLTGYTIILMFLAMHMGVLFSMPPTLTRARIALKKIEELGGRLEPEIALERETPAGWGAFQSLELREIRHQYPGENGGHNFSIGPIDLELRPGELVFITGGNGSGKTTLAKILMGLYEPASGTILFNGRPVDETNRDCYRQNFSVVFSDFFLFDSLLGMDHLDADAGEYLKKLQLDHKVKVENGVLSTIDLSQGQRKRLALLTAYMEDRPIYLFDEWAADQDPRFKKLFYYQLLPELKERGKCVAVISHDDHYYDVADRIIKLEEGRMI